MPQCHHLKISTEYFDAIVEGRKTFEVRKKDRIYRVGDVLFLREYIPYCGYTGRETHKQITYILDDLDYCKEGFVILGLM